MFTLGNYMFFGFLLFVGIVFISVFLYERYYASAIISAVISIIIIAATIVGVGWYNTHTASGARALKDYRSEMQNGIEREIRITAEDGREIFYYEGKIDVESNHEDNYIKFESEEGKRYIIYYGVMDTITIIEK